MNLQIPRQQGVTPTDKHCWYYRGHGDESRGRLGSHSTGGWHVDLSLSSQESLLFS